MARSSTRRKVFNVSNGQDPNVLFEVKARDGRGLYRLECHNWKYEGDQGFTYSGDFECRLTPRDAVTAYSTLLTDDVNSTRDWESRARFLVPELVGTCASYAEYGRIRNFRLRGMRLQLALTQVRFDSHLPSTAPPLGELASFRLSVTVQKDASATSEIAEPAVVKGLPAICGDGYRSPTPDR